MRADLVRDAAGPTDYPPTEAMWAELEGELQALRRAETEAYASDSDFLATDSAKQLIYAWKQRHNLLPAE